MSRMERHYQGVRARQMLDMLKVHEKNSQPQANIAHPDTLHRAIPEIRSFNCSDEYQITKSYKITKSNSLSSIPNHHHFISHRRRCSSLPPTIIVPYGKRNSIDNILCDVRFVDRARSLSLSALTSDDTKDYGKKRFCSVPHSFFFPNEYSQIFESESNNSIAESRSYDGDYSGNDSDITYCPDHDQESNSSTPESNNSSPRLLLNQPSTSSDIYHGNPNEGRERKNERDPDNWKKLKNKKLRMLGQEYLGYTKPKNRKLKQDKVRPARKLGDRCNSQFCRKSKVRHCEEYDDRKRQEIHNSFWKNMNWDQRKVYVVGLVNRKGTTRKSSDQTSRREGTFDYFLPMNDGENLQVCRTTFLNTLCLGSYTVQSWVKKSHDKVIPCQEIQNNSRIRTPRSGTQRKLLTARNFLDSIPKLPSHYARKETTKLYLEPVYRSLSDLYRQYKKHCTENEEPVVSRFTFEKLFHEKNLSLYTLKKDMCDTCCGHAVGNVSTFDYEQHIRLKNRARQEKETDKREAASGEFILLCMDLECIKVCPYLTASALYFKTKLTCHNFTMYDLVTHHASCYWFNETSAHLTASTFTSFVFDYILRYCLPKRLPIVIYSDGCTYQNRNNIMANALLNISVEHNVTITQKYLERGHTQMECDAVHAAIERKLKNREIHLPSDYITVTKEARINPFSYEAVEINYDFVKDFNTKAHWRYNTIRPGRKAGDPVVVNLRVIQYRPNGNIYFKINDEDEWSQLPIRPKKLSSITYSSLNVAPIPIASAKFNHLQQLKEVLPRDCHAFYDNLPHE